MQELDLGTKYFKWTWADLISSYRFWGLCVFSSLTLFISLILHLRVYSMLYNGLDPIDFAALMSLKSVTTVLAIIPAWLASRLKNKMIGLYLFGVFIILGMLVFPLMNDNLFILYSSVFVIYLFIAAIVLLVAGLIAKALDSVEFYILIFGFVAILKFLVECNYSSLLVYEYSIGDQYLYILGLIIMVIAMLFLLPIRKDPFAENPPIRQVKGVKDTYHDPIAVFFLTIIVPFYFVYWFVRVHRLIRVYSQSAKLMTPAGAGWSVFFVPFAMPIMLITLNDVINEQQGEPKKANCGLILLSLFLLPFAIAKVQGKLNRLNANEPIAFS
ncbi:hypothetical protein RCS94_10520 [Orbaceae bacterium ac157xtp]